ncbi:MAG: DUF3566 domain-containing protein [Acidobacteria bacterium]|nr:DUF3566 domain-containing protein [Acidobacteriota bacterium]
MAKMVVKRMGVLSVAKIYGVMLAGIGLVIGVPLGLIMMVIGAAAMTRSGSAGGLGVGMGVAYIIFIPIFYGVLGFVVGALSAFIYNVASGFIGGLELEMENADTGYATPPPPQWGAGTGYQQGSSQSY